MAANAAQYGVLTVHFYWIGAIPAMVFLALFMMPFYYGSGVASVPEYLSRRFNESTRAFNAVSLWRDYVAACSLWRYQGIRARGRCQAERN
ncbi:MAG: hypothetical protein K8F91_11940 [Candidatus Obscuribacterales bacterium]|nr:hypothetical protein [Candidatus Obscuribacterales bacterium]